MGKASRKKEKSIKKKEEKDLKKKGKAIRGELDDLLEKGQYTAALDTIVKILQADGGDAEVYYKAAYCYYMEEDYDRALKWVNETLGKDPNSVKTKVLLARICWFKHRVKDALAILNLLMDKARPALSEDDLEFVRDFMEDAAEDEDVSMEDYPALLAYKQEADEEKAEGEKDARASEDVAASSALTSLESLKEKLQNTAERSEAAPAKHTGEKDSPAKPEEHAGDDAEKAAEEPKEAAASSALEALEALKAKLRGRVEQRRDTSAAHSGAFGGDAKGQDTEPAEKKPHGKARAAKTAEEISDEILQKQVSVAEKIRLLNSFAAGFYAKDDYASAQHLLTTALRVDDRDSTSIRNMAFTLKALGEDEKAMAFAVKLPVADFAVISALKE